MGTVLPSGSVALCLVAVRLTVPVETTVAGGSAIATPTANNAGTAIAAIRSSDLVNSYA